MRALRPTLLLVALVFAASALAPPPAQAQLWKRAKERAKERLQQRAEDRVDQAVDDAVDSAVDRAWDGAADRVAGMVGAAAGGAAARATTAQPPEELALGSIATAPADAPAFSYRETTVVEMPALGAFARLGGQEPPSVTTVTMSATHARHDDGESATIMDAETGTITLLDHAARTATRTSAEAMMARVRGAQQDAERQMEQAQREAGESSGTTPEGVRYDVAVSAEATGRSESVLGAQARQTLVVIETQVDASEMARAEGHSEADAAQARGRFVTLIETWTASDVAGSATHRAFAERMGHAFGAAAQSSFGGDAGTGDFAALAAFGMSPADAHAAFAAASRALADIDGLPVRTVTHMVLVPDGQAFDADAVLAGEPGGASGLAALAGGQRGASAGQVVLFRTTTYLSDLAPTDADASVFAVPEGYRTLGFGE